MSFMYLKFVKDSLFLCIAKKFLIPLWGGELYLELCPKEYSIILY